MYIHNIYWETVSSNWIIQVLWQVMHISLRKWDLYILQMYGDT